MMYYKKRIISKFEYSLASVLSTNAMLFLIASGVSLDLIYKSLNRTVLYQLSRPINTVSGQTMVLDSLHKLTTNRTLIFGPKNYDTEFLVCLCYCLLQLTEEDPEKRYINQGFIVDLSRTSVKKKVILILLLLIHVILFINEWYLFQILTNTAIQTENCFNWHLSILTSTSVPKAIISYTV